jgi:hypothetical protein
MNKQRTYAVIPVVCLLIFQCIAFAGDVFKEVKDRAELSTASVQSVLTQWEEAKKLENWKKREAILWCSVKNTTDKKIPLFYEVQNPPFAGSYCLKYRNPELNDIICDIFLYEATLHTTWINQKRSGGVTIKKSDIPNDEDDEYRFLVASLALSTFSPKIYDQAWSNAQGGKLFYEYIGRVEPAKTLSSLLQAIPNKVDIGYENVGYQIPEKESFITLDNMFHVFSRILILHPDVAEKNEGKILAFIKPKALNYSTHQNMKTQDYLARLEALNILQQIGKIEDIVFIQNTLLKDIPPVPEARFIDSVHSEDGGMNLKIKAEKVIEAIKNRTSSSKLSK